jgi:hypothetical protein
MAAALIPRRGPCSVGQHRLVWYDAVGRTGSTGETVWSFKIEKTIGCTEAAIGVFAGGRRVGRRSVIRIVRPGKQACRAYRKSVSESAGDYTVTLSELLPALHGLPRVEKLRAIEVLAADVAREEGDTAVVSEGAYPIWSPYDAFEGAATLMRVLNEEQAP